MFNKKGGGHVDWIVSIGIFLVYLLGMFVLIKPGVIPVHDADTLLDIMEEKVKEDIPSTVAEVLNMEKIKGVYWTLNKIPLFVKGESSGCIEVNFPYNVGGGAINVYEIEPNGAIKTPPLVTAFDGNTLSIDLPTLSPGYEKYVIYYSGDVIYNTVLAGEPDLFNSGTISNCDPPADSDYRLGVNEKTKGMSKIYLDYIKGVFESANNKNTYDKLKEVYGYPKSKEFSLTITKINLDGSEEIPYNFKVIEPDAKTNVYTRQWSDFILNYDGTRNSVKISIKVW